MKYKIIGWTSFDNDLFPKMKFISDNAYITLLREIREKDLTISGYDHQENGWVPVFNTGEVVKYSSRGWGQVMADALEYEQKTGYEYSYYGVGGAVIGYNKDEIYFRDNIKLPKLEDICDYYKIHIGEQTLKNYEKGDNIFPMYINTELNSVDSLDRIIFDHKGKTIETEVIGKFTSKPEAKEKEIIDFLNSYISDEKESLEEEAKNEALKYDDYEIKEINKKIKMRYISLLEPQTTMISNPERKALVLRVLKENLK